MFSRLAFASLALLLLPNVALADDWVVTKLRGLAFEHSSGQWVKLKRGDVVPDSRVIRTWRSGRVEFTRGAEVISLGGDSQIQIVEAQRENFTTVKQSYGKVSIEAEKQNIQHFAVETQYLAAVVKGTKFTVTTRNGSSEVDVSRGRVEVRDLVHDLRVDVLPGQSADVSNTEVLNVTGRGKEEPILSLDGTPVGRAELKQIAEQFDEERSGGASNQLPTEVESAGGMTSGLSEDRSGGNSAGRNGNGNTGNGNSASGNSDQPGNGSTDSDNGNSGNGNGNSGNGNSSGGNNGNGNSSGSSDQGNGGQNNSDKGNGDQGNSGGNNGNGGGHNGNGNGNGGGNNGNGGGNNANGNGNGGSDGESGAQTNDHGSESGQASGGGQGEGKSGNDNSGQGDGDVGNRGNGDGAENGSGNGNGREKDNDGDRH